MKQSLSELFAKDPEAWDLGSVEYAEALKRIKEVVDKQRRLRRQIEEEKLHD